MTDPTRHSAPPNPTDPLGETANTETKTLDKTNATPDQDTTPQAIIIAVAIGLLLLYIPILGFFTG